MPWSALPDHIDEPHEWEGSDWDNPWQRWMLKIKGWFFYGPRAKEWWARWREIPIVLLAFNCTRSEHSTGDKPEFEEDNNIFLHPWNTKKMRARKYWIPSTQYWRRWSFAVQWPFHVHFHCYWKKESVLTFPEHRDFTIREMLFIRFGARRDTDMVYNFPSLFIGGDFV